MSLSLWRKNTLNKPLKQFDPQLYRLIAREKQRQYEDINLIASENTLPRYCSDALASCLSNKYSEGKPGKRFYEGNQFIDEIESLAQTRALNAFELSADKWAVNVQSLSGSPANFQVISGLLKPEDRIMYLDLPHGGHLSHGYKSATANITSTSKFFNTKPYFLNVETEKIDYDTLREEAVKFKPHMIIAGASSYAALYDYKRFREICDEVNAILLVDMAHIAGLIAAKVIASPFEYADVVTTTTHKTLRGPRGALIFMKQPLSQRIDKAVFPGCQGGPHNHTIAAVAASLKAAASQEYRIYQQQVLKNAKTLCDQMKKHGYRVISGTTKNHNFMLDLKPVQLDGKVSSQILARCGIITNMNTTLNDTSALRPFGLRLGTSAMTSRGMKEKDFLRVSRLISDSLNVARLFVGRKDKLIDLKKFCIDNKQIQKLRNETRKLAMSFPMPKTEL